MSDEQFSELCRRYAHPTMKDHVKWKVFVEDIDQGIYNIVINDCTLLLWYDSVY